MGQDFCLLALLGEEEGPQGGSAVAEEPREDPEEGYKALAHHLGAMANLEGRLQRCRGQRDVQRDLQENSGGGSGLDGASGERDAGGGYREVLGC